MKAMAVKTLVIAPHPDDETLGCGGTLLRRKAEGAEIAWLMATAMTEAGGWSAEQVKQRDAEIDKVSGMYGFDAVFRLDFPTTRLDTVPMADVVGAIADALKQFQPSELLIPHPADVHSDHRVVFDAATACSKWFRHDSISRVLAYETVSETEFGFATGSTFQPNVFVDITDHLERKLDTMRIYASELGTFPFPRSIETIRAKAQVHGATSGFAAAEAFQLLRERS